MELIFQEKQVQYLKQIFNETVLLEQTADLIVPDSLPDIERVVDAFATAMIRSADCAATGASAEGIAQAGALFVGEDGSLQTLAAQIPFSVRRDFAQPQENCTLQCRCTIRSVDARAVNSRKLLIRVGIACTLTAFTQAEHTLFDLPEPAPNLQLRRIELPLTMPLAVGDRSFVLHEELEVPSDKPAVERLLKCVYRTQLAEQKIVGDKAVFKGSLLLHALYEDREAKPISCEWHVPFSQYVPLAQELDDAQLQTYIALTGAEVEPDSQSDCRRLLLSVNLLAQCTAFGQRKIGFIDDGFCTDALLTPQYTSARLTGILDRQLLRETATATSDEAAKSVVDAWVYCDEANRRRSDGGMELELPLNCNVMYYDDGGNLQGKTLRSNACVQMMLSEQASCAVTQVDSGELFCTAGAGGMEVRMPLAMSIESSAEHQIDALSGGEISPLEETSERRASVILRRTDSDEELWQIAKAYRTSMRTIMEANELQESAVANGTMLLIPL